jgi:hypothetical protein
MCIAACAEFKGSLSVVTRICAPISGPSKRGDLVCGGSRRMADTPAPAHDPAQRICEILARLRGTVEQSIIEIERIAELEVRRHGDDTLEGIAWCDFGDALHSDVAHAAHNIQWEIAAVRGSLIYRGLDGGHQGNKELLGDSHPRARAQQKDSERGVNQQ